MTADKLRRIEDAGWVPLILEFTIERYALALNLPSIRIWGDSLSAHASGVIDLSG
jgi:hypothetical protein